MSDDVKVLETNMQPDLPPEEEWQPKRFVFLKRFFRNKGVVVGSVIFAILILAAVFAPYLTPYDYAQLDIMNAYAAPSREHLLGTDELGRDTLCRLLYGARYSMSIALGSNVIGLLIGSFLGSMAGYFGGMVDNLIMRFFDILQAIPGILLSMVCAIALGSSLMNLTLALSVGTISNYARILRAQILSIRQMEYVEAAKATNCGVFRIILEYLFPNAMSPIIVAFTGRVPGTLLAVSSLAFIGLGIAPPTPEWGSMVSKGRDYIRSCPRLIIVPGCAILCTVLALNMIGDGLRDALDPKLKN